MPWILKLAAVLAALAAAVAAHWLFWRWRLGLRGREDERHFAATPDGWRLFLGRRRPAGRPRLTPVLLLHGIAMNRLALDFPVDRNSLARHLAAGGLDSWALDLRGAGDSRPGPGAPRRWTLDDYLAQDIPAALDAIRAATGQAQVLLVGHSQGALLALVAAGRYPDRIAGVVALVPPVRFPLDSPLLRLVPWLPRLHLGRRAAQLVAPLAGLLHPRLAGMAIRADEMERPVLRRLLMNGIEDLPPGVVAHFERMAREERLGSFDGSEDWRSGLSRSRQPALFWWAPEDGLVPPAVVAEAHERWGGEKVLRASPPGVGHTDLLLGRRAPEALFPALRDWLVERSPPAGPPAAGPPPGGSPSASPPATGPLAARPPPGGPAPGGAG